jgi:glycosyltransferase involved in cell wall biosynthesis
MKNKQKCIVTITDGISPTSMPYNEFVLFRLKQYPEEKQVLIQVFERGINGGVCIPNGIEYHSLGLNALKIMKIVHHLEKNYNVKAYHIHEGKSVILFSIATLLTKCKKTVYTIHSTFKNYTFHNKLFCFIASLLAKYVVCVSKTSLKYYPRILKWLKGAKALSIQNGVDTDRIVAVSGEKSKDRNYFSMVYVARLIPLKRHYILLEALKQIPDTKLILIGQGQLREELEKKVKEYRLEDQVLFRGLLPREEVYRQLKSADLYVSTSSYEGLPIGVLEAMGCGVVCLVTNIEQHKEIANECPSLITISDRVEDWIEAINRIRTYSDEQINEISKSNMNDVFNKFSLHQMHNNYDKVYNLCSSNK